MAELSPDSQASGKHGPLARAEERRRRPVLLQRGEELHVLRQHGIPRQQWQDAGEVMAASRGLGGAMPGIEMETLEEHERMANRGW